MSAAAISSSLAFWPGLFLALGGVAKFAEIRAGIDQNSLPVHLKPGPVPLTLWIGALATAELAVGVLVLAGVATPAPEWAAAVLLGSATAAATWGLWKVPNADCGCFGPRSGGVSIKTVVRAGLLLALAIVAALGGDPWWAGFDELLATIVLNVAVGGVLLALSPEFTLDSVRMLWNGDEDRSERPQTVGEMLCVGRLVPIYRHIARLQDSEQWRLAEPYITNTRPSEFWQEGCWRYVLFDSSYDGRDATAVFALHLGIHTLSRSVVFVDPESQAVLGRVEVKRRGPDPMKLVTRKDRAQASA